MVTIGFPASAGMSMQMIQKEATQQAVADVCAAFAGRRVRLRLVTLEEGAQAPTVADLRRDREVKTERHLRDEVLANPLVKEVLTVFGGEVKDVRRNRARADRESKGD